MPQISVVMPAYNTEEKFLREAIESILNQTFKDFEFIIVNDCSTTNVEEIIFSYKDDRIVYLKNEKNMGVAPTLNVGLKHATGKYIARMDSDDVSFDKRLEIQYNFLEKNPQYQLCATRISKAKKRASARNMDCEYQKAKIILRANPIIHPTVMFNREFFAQNNLYYNNELTYCEDWDLWFRFSLVGKLVVLPERLLYYRQHPKQANKKYEQRHYQFCKEHFERAFAILGFEITPEAKDLFLNFMIAQGFESVTFAQWKLIIGEIHRLLKFIKENKTLSLKHARIILFKKILSYSRHCLMHK